MLQSELPTLMHNDASKSVAISYFSLWHWPSGTRPPCSLVYPAV